MIPRNPFILPDLHTSTGDIKAIKDAFVANELRTNSTNFTHLDTIDIFAGTWNIAGLDCTESLAPWLTMGNEPDLYILGFQELDLSTEAYLMYDSAKETQWCQAVETALMCLSKGYAKVASKQLVGMLAVVYLNVEHLQSIAEITAESIGTGILGLMGNKGAAGIRFRLYDSYITVVNCHLAADANMIERRNQDYQLISKRLALPIHTKYATTLQYYQQNSWVSTFVDSIPSLNGTNITSTAASPFIVPTNPKLLSVFDTDHLIWMGDLNYRISLPEGETKTMIKENRLKNLLEYDQLNRERKSKMVFNGFLEHDIEFKPTYKYDLGTSTYDSSEKKRCPSYCDRILWFKNPLQEPDWMKCTLYNSCDAMLSSDHKPVTALLQAKIRKIDKDKLSVAHSECVRVLDRLENDAIPVLNLETNLLDFGLISPFKKVLKTVILTNPGQVIVDFKVIPKNSESKCSKDWYLISPMSSSIPPRSSLPISIECVVGASHVSSLNRRDDTLDDIIIIHIAQGQDHFITLTGQWQASCFGERICALQWMLDPIQSYTQIQLDAIYKRPDYRATSDVGIGHIPELTPKEGCLSIPKELWKIIDFIYKYGMDVNELFEREGDADVALYMRGCLDTSEQFDLEMLFNEKGGPLSKGRSIAVHSACDTFCLLLSSFADPIIPVIMQDKGTNEGFTSRLAAAAVLGLISGANYNTLIYILAFLSQVIAEFHGTEALSVSTIGITLPYLGKKFAPLLIPYTSSALSPPTAYSYFFGRPKDATYEIEDRKVAFLCHLLESNLH